MFRSPVDGTRGRMRVGPVEFACALGRTGTTHGKREGDGGTPNGRFRILAAYYRPDRIHGRPRTDLPLHAIRPDLGWCDAPGHRRYNRLVRLPFAASHEHLWRADALYDLVLDLSYNRGPIVPGRGSAIFLHSARPTFTPTEGCVAVARSSILRLIGFISQETVIHVVG